MSDEYIDDENAELYDPQSAGDLLTIEEVMSLLGKSRTTIQHWRKRGLLTAYRVGFTRNVRFKRDEVLAIADQTVSLKRI